MTKNILFETVVGSHIWDMDTEASDTDIFQAYIAPSIEILKGTAKTKSKFMQEEDKDIAQHEIGKIVDQLLKGNFNFIVGVMSPIIVKSNRYHEALKQIITVQLSKNCYHSVHGMAVHNSRKYIETKKDTSERRCNKILRGIVFGQHILEGKGSIFEKVENGTPEKIKEEIEVLDDAYKNSKLTEVPEEKPFRDWLLSVRLSVDITLGLMDQL